MVSRARIDLINSGNTIAVFRIIPTLLVIWLAIGALAGWQRHYYRDSNRTCAHAGTIIATVAAGPLNYLGANPKVHCSLPSPSK
ncbi:MAG TPA: hypothetical protein VG650_03180 [Mycobacteriales bacterium]|nr:hypothetical protein [Mycobacteriales bacterium]